jgi:rubrerythrin
MKEAGSQKAIKGESQIEREGPEAGAEPALDVKKRILLCDWCGFEMLQMNCKLVCPNCGSRFDCSDLTIYFD